ncbi:hypothetical protein X737_12035 [Mesorhizobium sp. L48C026A00]|nr:hypothetical protein X737_12035 [Mesorhizobium sp. L48C026A00]
MYTEKGTKRPPPFGDLISKKALGRQRCSHRSVMSFIDGDCMMTVIKATSKDTIANYCHTKGLWVIAGSVHRKSYCLRHAVIPGFGVTNCENNFCIRVVIAHFAPEMRRWPIDSGTIAGICQIPVRELSLASGAPQLFLFGVGIHVCHMMARPEPKMLQCQFQRIRAGATHARANDI